MQTINIYTKIQFKIQAYITIKATCILQTIYLTYTAE